jgi:hypothetical protein
MPKNGGNEISRHVGQLRGLLLWDVSGCIRTTSQVSVEISTEAGRLTTLPSLSSVYELITIRESPNGGLTTKHRPQKYCIFRVVPS